MDNAKVPGDVRKARLRGWVETYGNAILRMCCVNLHSASLAEDALQETFIKAWQHMEQLDASPAITEKAWLMRIAINVCHDYYRSRWFRHTDRRIAIEDLPPSMLAVLPEDHSLLEEVYALPEKYRQVILLYYYQEMTLRETADCLGIGTSTAHKRLKKAQSLLRGQLTGREL